MPMIKRKLKQYKLKLSGTDQEGVHMATLTAPVRGEIHLLAIINDAFMAIVEEPADDEAPRKEDTTFLIVQPGNSFEFDPDLVHFYQLMEHQGTYYMIYTQLDAV